jgi:hypothetical protein
MLCFVERKSRDMIRTAFELLVKHESYLTVPWLRRLVAAEALVRSRASPCEICGGQSGTGTGLSPSTSVSPVNFIPSVLHYKEKAEKHNHLHHSVAQ